MHIACQFRRILGQVNWNPCVVVIVPVADTVMRDAPVRAITVHKNATQMPHDGQRHSLESAFRVMGVTLLC